MKPKYKNRRSSKVPKILVVITLLVILVAGIGGYLLWSNWSNIFGSKESSDLKEKPVDKDGGAPLDKTDPEKPPTDQNWTPNDRPVTFDVWITSKNIVDGMLRIRVQTNKYLSNGTCTIEIGDYSETVNVSPGPQASTCEGFDIPTSNFSGNDFTITVESGEEIGKTKGEF